MKASLTAIARVLTLSGTVLAASCVPSPQSTPTPSPSPVQQAPAPSPAPSPTPTPHYESWMDAPRTPGDWSYRADVEATMASYGAANSEYRFAIACNLRAKTVQLLRYYPGTAKEGPMTIRTETVSRTLAATPSSGNDALVVSVGGRDPLLDAMAMTKGRFAVETSGMPTLYLPAWAEVTRVIEDCR